MRILRALLDLVFPVACLGCKAAHEILCDACLRSISIKLALIEQPSASLDRIMICASYEHPLLKKAIKTFKYGGVTGLAEPLATILTHGFDALRLTSAVVMPIPLHRRKLKSRGFNQSQLLAELLCRQYGLRLDLHLTRRRNTRSQSALNRTERLRNVSEAFSYYQHAPAEVLLVDDITTTFATLDNAAKALRALGAKRITGLVIARNRP